MSTLEGVKSATGPEGSALILRVPGKINLWLEVTGKREDGYHDLSSLMLPISVFDRISVGVRPGGDRISIACDTTEIPSDERNLAWRAAELYLKAAGKRAGVDIDIEKRIPWGAGLGGGSSDGAGVLVALNSFFENAVPPADSQHWPGRSGPMCLFFSTPARPWRRGLARNSNLRKNRPTMRCF